MRSFGWGRLVVAAGLIGALLLGSGQAREARAGPNLRDFSFDRALGSPRLQRSEPFAYRQQTLPRRRLGPPPLGGDIYAMNSDGSGQVNLTNNEADDYLPAWSPDGTKIAFVRYSSGPGAEIYVMNADGTGQVDLTNGANDSAPAWSPDGTKIAFVRFGATNTDIYVMNADGSNQVNLTNSSIDEADPAWSPAGTKIAYTNAAADAEIYVMDADGANQTNVTNDPSSWDSLPSWSPDGTRIAYARSLDFEPWEIYAMDADGSNKVNVTNTALSDWDPAWAASGARIAFTRTPEFESNEIYAMDADGSNQANLTNNPASDTQPAWSPDSNRIAFARYEVSAFDYEIAAMNADGSALVPLTNHPGNGRHACVVEGRAEDRLHQVRKLRRRHLLDELGRERAGEPHERARHRPLRPHVVPDRARIAFSRYDEDHDLTTDIWAMNADGTEQVDLTNTELEDERFPSWSPDGTKVAFTRFTTGGDPEIFVMDADGSNQVNLTNYPRAPTTSPPGRRMGCTSHSRATRVRPRARSTS